MQLQHSEVEVNDPIYVPLENSLCLVFIILRGIRELGIRYRRVFGTASYRSQFNANCHKMIRKFTAYTRTFTQMQVTGLPQGCLCIHDLGPGHGVPYLQQNERRFNRSSMLKEDLKESIQTAYRRFLAEKALKPRWGQRLMIAEVAKTVGSVESNEEGERITDDHVVVVEAGTGTGKTVAYLLATIPVARAFGKSLVVSTATVSLQEQLLFKDIPEVLTHSGLNFSVGLAKGRGRYLCLSHLNRLMSHDASDPNLALWEDFSHLATDKESAALFKNMHDEIEIGRWDGDRDNWPTSIADDYWRKVAADYHGCTGRNCAFYEDCFFYKARTQVHSAEVIIANHDLVLADLSLGGGNVLPPPEKTIYVFDEGHHLPDKALNHLACSMQIRSTQQWLKERSRWLEAACRGVESGMANQWVKEFQSAVPGLHESLDELYFALQPFSSRTTTQDAENGRWQFRFPLGEDLAALSALWLNLGQACASLLRWIQGVITFVQECIENKRADLAKGDAEAWLLALMPDETRIEMIWSVIDVMGRASNNDNPWARWLNVIETSAGQDIELCASPILPGPLLKSLLWDRCFAAVVTSATLTALGTFDRFRHRAGVPPNTRFAEVPSPFDYSAIATLWLADVPFAPDDGLRHNMLVVDTLLRHQGEAGVLVLFTSRRQMEEVYSLLPPTLVDQVLMQSRETKKSMIDKHKKAIDESRSSIIFGLASFAEGVDLPGDYCKALIIARLPFAVPDAPVDAALSEWVTAKGGRPFFEITVPDAAIRLKQMVGRLIRTEQDHGDIYLLDSRVLRKPYGKLLLKSLPPMAIKHLKG